MGLFWGSCFLYMPPFTPGRCSIPFSSVGTVWITQYSMGPGARVIVQPNSSS